MSESVRQHGQQVKEAFQKMRAACPSYRAGTADGVHFCTNAVGPAHGMCFIEDCPILQSYAEEHDEG